MKLGNLGGLVAVLGCVGVALGTTFASQGCTVTATSGGDAGPITFPPGDDSGTPVVQQDSGSVPPDPCNLCLYGQCAGLYSICVGDPGCLAIYNCATAPACASDATGNCITNCINAQSAASQNIYDALGTCDFEGQCNGGACGTTCNPSADYCSPVVTGDDGGADTGTVDSGTDSGTVVDADVGDTAVAQTCDQCQKSACATQLAACQSGTQCFAYNQCVLGCTTAECPAICASNNPAGLTAAQALGTCTTTSCAVCTQ